MTPVSGHERDGRRHHIGFKTAPVFDDGDGSETFESTNPATGEQSATLRRGTESAVEIQNDTDYGLAGAIVSEDCRQLDSYRDHAKVGLAYANHPCIGAGAQLPSVGVTKSDSDPPHARAVIDAVTERAAWALNNATEIRMAQELSAERRNDE